MSTLIITIIILAIVAAVGYSYVKNLRAGSSCCTEGDGPLPKKVKVDDRDESHYPYKAAVTIDGMICAHCVRNVENALNSLPGTWAKVDLGQKKAEVLSKEPIAEKTLRQAVKDSGYTMISYSDLGCGL